MAPRHDPGAPAATPVHAASATALVPRAYGRDGSQSKPPFRLTETGTTPPRTVLTPDLASKTRVASARLHGVPSRMAMPAQAGTIAPGPRGVHASASPPA
jgi:hypothetical protein